ncbi:MAG: hypothetical protein LBG77_07200 [Dysgonamonadaceae bacterium]|jgi:uncharacterized protein (TIGR02145 family)|nr:hypothetical protein [Dysgonamonadaceae bacterium]
MRTFGKFLSAAVIAAGLATFAGCDMGMETVHVSQEAIIFEHAQATNEINLGYSDGEVFTVSGETDWCKASQDGASWFTVSVSTNQSSEKRTATLVFSTDKYNKGTVEVTQNSREIDEANDRDGVVINGIRWATRNVDAPGTFAASPESAGMFYRWNTKVAHPSASSGTAILYEKDLPVPTGSTWEKANDPSPAGWRVPTYKELMTLHNLKYPKEGYSGLYGWGTSNGVYGIRYTDIKTGNSLFLQANEFFGTRYWSSTPCGGDKAYRFNTAAVSVKHDPSSYDDRRERSSIRCVKE